MVRRGVVDAIGLPDPSYFIFYDDVDFASAPAGPASGSRPSATRCWCASSTSTSSTTWTTWKGFYMYRNLFVVHLRYGENALVRLKPWLITPRWCCSARCAAAAPRRAM